MTLPPDPSGSVRLRVTNLASGVTELDTTRWSTSFLVDDEGAQVSSSTPYEVEADLVSTAGDVLGRSVVDVTSASLR